MECSLTSKPPLFLTAELSSAEFADKFDMKLLVDGIYRVILEPALTQVLGMESILLAIGGHAVVSYELVLNR